MEEEKPKHPPINSYNRHCIDGYDSLEELALDLHWSWSRNAVKIYDKGAPVHWETLWQWLDPSLWELTHNPWIVLQTVSKEKLEIVLADSKFRKILDDLLERKRKQDQAETWFQKNHPDKQDIKIAYFSMEYMLSEALPIYSGGLGNVAGDQLKAASDLGVPVVAVGLLYQQGYFRQMIDKDGNQQALYPYNDPGQLPITPLRKSNGEWLRLEVSFPGYSIWIRTWKVQVGRTQLLLLDTNDVANFPAYRAMTSELYGGGPELRIQQEMLLGIAGWRLLEALGIKPDVCHLNEGHAAFAILERAKNYMKEAHLPFEAALAVTRAGNVFTTHTAVPAGFDRFEPALIEKYLSRYAGMLGISMHDFLALGRLNPNDSNELFNMAFLAMRGCGACNGVSRLHGEVSRQIFEPLFPRWPEKEIPVGYVTNGVHVPSWNSRYSDAIWKEMCGEECWRWVLDFKESEMNKISDMKLWKMRSNSRKSLVEYVRSRHASQLAARGATIEEIEKAITFFDENTLTLGFARRFATYKRPNMLLHDPDRLLRILTNPQYPVQLIIAGKAHPADKAGQALIKQWMQFIFSRPEARAHITFLSDYDMLLTERLVQGVDVWINTPRRPWEACGTSGMKVLVNGGLNISELDGWWVEAYTPEVGWAIGDGKTHGDDPTWNAIEANKLYDILENEVVPVFYHRNREGISEEWLAKMRASMSRLTPRFSANRAVRDYVEEYYFPAAERYHGRIEKKMGPDIIKWKRELALNWSKIRFNEIRMEKKEDKLLYEAQVYLDGLRFGAVELEIYSEGTADSEAVREKMKLVKSLEGESNCFVYSGAVPANRPEMAYTLRIVPTFSEVAVPLEEDHILWQK